MSAAGELTDAELHVVQTGPGYAMRLANPAARAWQAARAGMARDGIAGLIVARDGAYRDKQDAQDLYNQWAGLPHNEDHNLNPHSGARPANPSAGEVSVHELGLCVDVEPAAAVAWMLSAKGKALGWTHPLSNDPNHFQLSAAAAASYGSEPLDNTTASTPTRRNPVLSIIFSFRDEVGEFLMWASPTGVTLSRELSMLDKDDRDYEVNRALDDARDAGLNYQTEKDIPRRDDTKNNGAWYLRNDLAWKVARMPADFPLTPSNPYTFTDAAPPVIDYSELAKDIATLLPAQDASPSAAEIAKATLALLGQAATAAS